MNTENKTYNDAIAAYLQKQEIPLVGTAPHRPYTNKYIQRPEKSPVIKEALPGDHETILDVIHRSFSTVADEFGLTPENCPNYTGFLPLEALNAQRERGWKLYQCRAGQKTVGCMALSDEGNGCFELHELAVLPEYRHLGYGTQLLGTARKIIRTSGGIS